MKESNDMRICRTIPLVLIAAVLSPLAHGGVIYVDGAARGAYTGTSWALSLIHISEPTRPY